MNASVDISMKTDEVLKVELEVFRRQHRDLDEAIIALQERGTSDQLTIRRLKKQKLGLKDKIAQIEDRLTPDIIA
ncbi:YdcH family protein [Phaeobacter sp. 11ANDIMAR09]|uniref:YdcH family protein n=1 Tax=Phaeobacter sp. 11ANDIMAR09 TaxID=1225647 RepID=UPI0006C85B9A|nr:DUF465 domain-containing protein [Phaeobacter sp. 11ANDIMAR09]KPD13803.1 hypothetical protein AN476_03860 [Phaeobacter sp. 11ANDIMAR09]OIQ35839.1 MAG: hypothetical protein BM559_00880 [Roseobacter sp. MedPE-SWchi]